MTGTNYMNDPRMSELKGEPLPVQEVHAWRLAIQDETKDMTPAERTAYYNKGAEATLARLGIKLKYATLE